jgi:hypothetical protein
MKKMLIGILIFVSCIVVSVFAYFAYFVYSVKTMHTSRTLAENVQISSEPTEISPEKPLEGKKGVQQIALLIDGYKPDIKDEDRHIKLADGTVVNPEIELVDENNNVHPLKISGRTFSENEVQVRFSGIDQLSVPRDLSYKSVRIRSDEQFRCSVYWKDYDLK